MLADPQVFRVEVPHDEFARRRRFAPVAWVDEPALTRTGAGGVTAVQRGTGFWAVTRHETVCLVSRTPEMFSSATRGAFLADPVSAADLVRARQLLVNMDAPEHTVTRRLVTAAFTPRAVRDLEASIHRHASEVVERVVRAGEFDVVGDLAAELPLLVLADLLGVPREDRGRLLAWSNNLVGFDDPDFGGGDVSRYHATFTDAFKYALALAADKRRHPGNDLVTMLATAEVDGRRITDMEFCQAWILMVTAGNETTRHLLTGGLLALTQHPDQKARLAADPTVTGSAVEEMLRWVTPIMQFRRTATADTILDGQPIAAGDKVVVYYISANRDERVFTDADRFDVTRAPNPHVAFGMGAHFCLGARLARTEAAALFDALRPHLPRFTVTGPPVRLASNFMNGIKSMPATITAGHRHSGGAARVRA